MHKELNAGKEGETYSSKVKQTLLKFLDTMWVRDYIKILFFNGDNPNVRPLLNDSFVSFLSNWSRWVHTHVFLYISSNISYK